MPILLQRHQLHHHHLPSHGRRHLQPQFVSHGLLTRLPILLLFMMIYNCTLLANALEILHHQTVAPPTLSTSLPTSSQWHVTENATNIDDDPTSPTQPYSSSDANDDDSSRLPSEIQKAVCTVTAGEVKASAEAVTTKTLKGVCGSDEMNLAFRNLELKLYRELQEIKILLLQHMGIQNSLHWNISPQQQPSQQQQQQQPIQQPQYSYTTSTTTTTTAMPTPTTAMPTPTTLTTTTPSAITARTIPKSMHINKLMTDFTNTPMSSVKLKSLPNTKIHHNTHKTVARIREQEINKFNNTMLTDQDLKIFTYYWKLENLTQRINSAQPFMVESPTFSIKGKALHIKAYFRHLHRDFLYLQLEKSTSKTSNRNNIILEMGGLFKEINNDKILFKHKISILDQNNQRTKDLVSQEFLNLDMGFLIPNSALLHSPYVKNDTLLIQIFLYL